MATARSTSPLRQFSKVYLRQRPFSLKERLRSPSPLVYKQLLSQQEIAVFSHANNIKKYSFDQIFDEDDTQANIFQAVVAPLVNKVINGYNCTVFAYGPVGSGKTHTIFGAELKSSVRDEASWGFIPRAAEKLFWNLSSQSCFEEAEVSVSFIEIIVEEMRDLLAGKDSPVIRLLENAKKITVSDKREVIALVHQATKQLQTQSHTILTFTVRTCKSMQQTQKKLNTTAQLQFVDLAGIGSVERKNKRSLFTLRMVINALARNSPEVPFDNSTLTRVLQDSLGGQTLTSMIATIAPPVIGSWGKTVQTLECARLVRSVAHYPVSNRKMVLDIKYTGAITELIDNTCKMKTLLVTYYKKLYYQKIITESFFVKLEDKIDRSEKSASRLWELRHGLFLLENNFIKAKFITNIIQTEICIFKINGFDGALHISDQNFKGIFAYARIRLKLIKVKYYVMKLSNTRDAMHLEHPCHLPKIYLLDTLIKLFGMDPKVPLKMSPSFRLELERLLKKVKEIVLK